MTEQTPGPQPLTSQEAASLKEHNVEKVKQLDCAFYSDCLDVAINSDWANFGCHSCTAYKALDSAQRALDWEALIVCREAADNVQRTTVTVVKDGKKTVRRFERYLISSEFQFRTAIITNYRVVLHRRPVLRW